LPEREVATTWDWSLLRKFNDFWPSTMSAPHDFPWLGDLVTRERAWRWASQFPRFFALVEASDSDIIRAFIARTLTEVEPPSPYEGESEEEKKGCCRKRPKEPTPSYPTLPDPVSVCWQENQRCKDGSDLLQTCCMWDEGDSVICTPTCESYGTEPVDPLPPGSPPGSGNIFGD
jgi:hypothetical protein